MRRVSGLPLALLFLASVYPSNAQSGAGAAAAAVAAREMRVPSGAPLLLECELGVAQRLRWRLDGGELPGDMSPAGEAARGAGAVWARLTAAAARPHHAGLYTCSDDAPRRAALRVSVLPPGEGALETAAAPPAGAGEGEGGDGDVMEVVYEVRGNLSLDCSALAPGSARAAGAASAQAAAPVWRVNGTELDELPAALRKRYKLAAEGGAILFVDGRSAEDDFGNYSCAVGGKQLAWSVRARTLAKLPANSNVVEGQKLKLTCKLVGKPYPAVEWLYSNVSEALNDSVPVAAAFGSRVSERASEQGVAGAELVLEGARRADAGWLTCRPQAPDALPAVTRLRVKDMYAALWPFLGICAEVFVLCAIILVYEKRRTKPELDDSDTDNHDQTRTEPALRPDEPVTVYIPLRPHPEPAPYQSVPPPIQPAPATIQSAPATIQSAPAPIQSGPAPIQTYTIRWDAVIQSTPAPIQTAPAPIQPAPPTIKAAPETIQSAPATIQSAPAPIQAARTPIQTGSAPIQSAPATIKAAPEPIQSAPATIQSALAPIQAARTSIQTGSAPIQSAPATIKAAPEPIQSAPATIQSAPAPIQAARTSIQTGSAPIQSAPATIKAAPEPIQSAPATIQSALAPIQAARTPIQTAPAPIQSAPAPMQSGPDPIHSVPAPIKSAAASALYHSPPTPVQSAPVTAPRHATNTSAQAPDHRAPAADQSTPARYSAPTTPDHPAPAPDHTAPSMLLHSIPPVAPPDYLSPPDTPPPPQPPLRCLPL